MIIDDLWHQIAPLFKRPGPQPDCSDSELLTLAIVGECRSWDVETEMLSYWQEHRDMFPNIPSQSRFNRRRRNLILAFNLIRRSVLQMLDLAQEKQNVIDSLPIPVVQFYLVPGSTGDWNAHRATYGKAPGLGFFMLVTCKIYIHFADENYQVIFDHCKVWCWIEIKPGSTLSDSVSYLLAQHITQMKRDRQP